MEYLQIGEIVRPQGIRGEVKLRAMSSDPDRYARLKSVYLLVKGQYVEHKVVKGRCAGGFAVLQLDGVNDRNEAETLRVDYTVPEHALLSLRGTGRVRLDEIAGETKKGRIALRLFVYGGGK